MKKSKRVMAKLVNLTLAIVVALGVTLPPSLVFAEPVGTVSSQSEAFAAQETSEGSDAAATEAESTVDDEDEDELSFSDTEPTAQNEDEMPLSAAEVALATSENSGEAETTEEFVALDEPLADAVASTEGDATQSSDAQTPDEASALTPMDNTPTLNAEGYYELTSAEDLIWFASYVAGTDAAAKAKLAANVDASAVQWVPIGTAARPYIGEFDGAGYTVTLDAVLSEGNPTAYGMFCSLNAGAYVHDLTVAGTLKVTDALRTRSIRLGGIAGQMMGGTLEKVTNTATVINLGGTNGATQVTGGVVGYLAGPSVIREATNRGTVTAGRSTGFYGGVVGWQLGTSTLAGCVNEAALSSEQTRSGGIVGQIDGGSLTNNVNLGNIDNTNTSAAVYVGGIVGNATAVTTQISGNTNKGRLSLAATNINYTGAVIGALANLDLAKITGNLYELGTWASGVGTFPGTGLGDTNVKAILAPGMTYGLLKQTNPTKTTYLLGESFELDGFSAKLLLPDGAGSPETMLYADSVILWDKAEPLTWDDTEVVLSIKTDEMPEIGTLVVPIQVASLGTLRLDTPPTKKLYTEGESFDKETIALSALLLTNKNVESSRVLVPDDWTFEPEVFSTADTKLTISYTALGTTRKLDITGFTVMSAQDTPPLANDNFYELSTSEHLLWFTAFAGDSPDAKGRLMADIDMSETTFGGIGGYTKATAYTGEFDGNNKTVTVSIEKPDNSYLGFFRYANGATIRDLTVAGSVQGRNTVGGIVGYAEGTTLTNVINKAAIVTTGAGGGITGIVYTGSTVTNAKNEGAIIGEASCNIGGIAGNVYGKIEYSINVGAVSIRAGVTASASLGGIAGSVWWDTGNLIGNENQGVVSGAGGRISGSTQTIGGIVGNVTSPAVVRGNVNKGSLVIANNDSSSVGSVMGALSAAAGLNTISNNSWQSGTAAKGIGAVPSGATVTDAHIRELLSAGTGKIIKLTDPTKPATAGGRYFEGETYSITGFTAIVRLADGTERPVTADMIDWDKKGALQAGVDTAVLITVTPNASILAQAMVEPATFSIPITVSKAVYELRINTNPTKLNYVTGETFDPTGMQAQANTDEGTISLLPTTDCIYTPTVLSVGDTAVTVTYTYKGVTIGANRTIPITVTDPDWTTPVADPEGFYPLGSTADLLWFESFTRSSVNASAKARLTADINLEGKSYTPIGLSSVYTGTFDGGGHTVTMDAATLSSVSSLGCGLFASVKDAAIKNVTVAGTITNSRLQSVGGIAGKADGATQFINCINRSNISGPTSVGGIVATVSSSAVVLQNCSNMGAISSSNVPTIVFSVQECYGAGGILGNDTSGGATVQGCSNTGVITSSGAPFAYAGGIVGFVMTEAGIGTGNTTSLGQLIGSRVDYDSGTGTSSNPFAITTAAQLDAMRVHMGASYKLGATIDLASFLSTKPSGWLSMKAATTSDPGFTGTLDGAGYEIRGLWSAAGGLFEKLAGTVENLGIVLDEKGIKGGLISSSTCSGAIAGELTSTGVLSRCSVSGAGSVSGGVGFGVDGASLIYVGGLVGRVAGGQIVDCSNSVAVFSNATTNGSWTGGIAGMQEGGIIDNCVNNGDITGAYNVGGIVGGLYGNGQVTNCTNNGTVTATATERTNSDWAVGGVVGIVVSGTVSGNTNNGMVKGTSDIPKVGSVVGGVSGTGSANISDNTYREGTAYVGVGGNTPQHNGSGSVQAVPKPGGGGSDPGGNPGGDPGTGDPGTGDPGTGNPGTGDPGTPNNPGTPGTSTGPVVSTPSTTPSTTQPASSTSTQAPQTNPSTPSSSTQAQPEQPTVKGSEVSITPLEVPLEVPLGFGFQNLTNALLTMLVSVIALAIVAGGGLVFWRSYKRRIS